MLFPPRLWRRNAQPTEARMTSTGVSSLLLTVTCMVTPSPSASLDLTSTSQPPLYTPEGQKNIYKNKPLKCLARFYYEGLSKRRSSKPGTTSLVSARQIQATASCREGEVTPKNPKGNRLMPKLVTWSQHELLEG